MDEPSNLTTNNNPDRPATVWQRIAWLAVAKPGANAAVLGPILLILSAIEFHQWGATLSALGLVGGLVITLVGILAIKEGWNDKRAKVMFKK
jgi:hypothetical protein